MTQPHDPGDEVSADGVASELRGVIGKLRRRLHEQAQPGEIGSSQVQVLYLLDRSGPATVTALARAEGMRPQSMGANIGPLEAAGLVQSAPDPLDRRQTLLSLTPKGRGWIAGRRAARQDWLAKALQAHLDGEELKTLAHALGLLTRLVQT